MLQKRIEEQKKQNEASVKQQTQNKISSQNNYKKPAANTISSGEKIASQMVKIAGSSIGKSLGRNLVRGLMGSLFGR